MQRKILSTALLLISVSTLSLSAMDKETAEQRRARFAAAAEKRRQAARDVSMPTASSVSTIDPAIAAPTAAVASVEEEKDTAPTVPSRKRVRALSGTESPALDASSTLPHPAVAPTPATMSSAAAAPAAAGRSAIEDSEANHFEHELFERATNLETFVSVRQCSDRFAEGAQVSRVIDALTALFGSDALYEHFTEINEQLDAFLNAVAGTEDALDTEDYPVYLTIENSINEQFIVFLTALASEPQQAAVSSSAAAAVVDEDDEEDALLQVALAMSTEGGEEGRPARRARSTRAAAAAANVALTNAPKGGGKRKK